MKSETLNSDPLQRLLASAFTVQETGMSRDWFVDLVELQNLIERAPLAGEAMQRITQLTRRVSDASGAAIALLKENELVYEACIGTAAIWTGQRVMAALSPSTPHGTETEILRVEDADRDARLQAAICRQFGARSLLILPLHSGPRLVGVLQIFFERAHRFSDREVQVYWMLASLAGQAAPLSSRPRDVETLTAGASTDNQVVEARRVSIESPVIQSDSPEGFKGGTLFTSSRAFVEEASSRSTIQQSEEVRVPWTRIVIPKLIRVWDTGVAALLVIAASVLTFSHYDRITGLSKDSATSVGLHSVEHVRSDAPSGQIAEPPLEDARVRKSATQVSKPSFVKRVSRLTSQVEYFGDDVTVWHFLPKSAVKQRSTETTVRRVSGDVTIRYFESRDVHRR